MADRPIEQVIIVGSGPAGYTAALYTARADLNPLVFEGFAWGGLLQQTTEVENYPGFPEGIMGPDLMAAFRAQAERFGARLQTVDVERIELDREGQPPLHRVYANGEEYRTRALILAMGAQHRKLGVPGEEEYAGRGVSYCATCDGAFFRDLPTVVVGGGDSAMEEAIFLARFSNKVVIVHRRNQFRASPIMVDRAKAQPNIEFLTPYTVEEILGEDGSVSAVRLRNGEDGSTRELPVKGVFVAIGLLPQSGLLAGQLDLDDLGYVKVEGSSTRTSVQGVFAAGDLTDPIYRQAVTAAGSGCRAALDAQWYLRDLPVGEPVAAAGSA